MKNLVDFKDELLKEPKKVLKNEFGVEFQENVEVKVLFETENIKYIVIPFTEQKINEVDLIKMGKGPCTTTSPRTHNSSC
jgi:hypothetical protein